MSVTISTLSPSTTCLPNKYEIPNALPGQTVTFCAVDTFSNHMQVLNTCCASSNGTISTSKDGCNIFCAVNAPLLNATQACFVSSVVPAFCGQTNITTGFAPTFPSSSPSSATSSAPSPSSSDAPRRYKPTTVLLGLVALLVVSMIDGFGPGV